MNVKGKDPITGATVKQKITVASRYSFLMEDYTLESYYWDIEVMLLKLLLSLIPAMAPHDGLRQVSAEPLARHLLRWQSQRGSHNTCAQVYGGLIISGTNLILYMLVRPYRSYFAAVTNGIGLAIATITMAIGLGIETNVVGQTESAGQALLVVNSIFLIVGILTALIQSLDALQFVVRLFPGCSNIDMFKRLRTTYNRVSSRAAAG